MDTPRSTISVSSTNFDVSDTGDEASLVEEFLHGMQYYEANESLNHKQSKVDEDRRGDNGYGQNTGWNLLDYFSTAGVKGINAMELAEICNRSLFEYSIFELQHCLQEQFMSNDQHHDDENSLLADLLYCGNVHLAGSKFVPTLLSFGKKFIEIAHRFGSTLLPMFESASTPTPVDDVIIGCKSLLTFLRQCLGITTDLISVDYPGSANRIADQRLRGYERIPHSPAQLLLLIFLCLIEFDDNEKEHDIPQQHEFARSDEDEEEIISSGLKSMESEQKLHIREKERRKRMDLAQEYLLRHVVLLCARFPCQVSNLTLRTPQQTGVDATLGHTDNDDTRKGIMANLAVLQTVLAAINESTHYGSESGVIASSMLSGLQKLSCQMAPYMPMVSFTVRAALLYACWGTRFDIVLTILKQPVTCSVSGQSVSSTQIISSGAIDAESLVQRSEQPMGDNTIIHFHRMTRIEAIQILSGKPTGTFIIRPHDTQADMMYLSFKSTSDEGVKHAVIRKDAKKDVPSKQPISDRYEYRCGKVGPCTSLEEMLRAIDVAIPTGLKFGILITKRELQANGIIADTDIKERRNIAPDLAPEHSPLTSAIHSVPSLESIAEENMESLGMGHSPFDCNTDLWTCIATQLQALGEFKDVPAGSPCSLGDGNSSSTEQKMDIHRYANELERDELGKVDDLTWYQFQSSFRSATMLEGVLLLLAVKSLHKQFSLQRDAMVLVLASALNSLDAKLLAAEKVSHCSDTYSCDELPSLWTSLVGYECFCDLLMGAFGHRLPHCDVPVVLDSQASSSQFSLSQIMLENTVAVDAFLSVVHSFVVSSEQRLLSQLVPTPPAMIPLVPDHLKAGILEGEELVREMMFAIPMHAVKFPGKGCGNGSDHALICFESAELMQYFSKTIASFAGPTKFSKAGKRLYNHLLACQAFNDPHSIMTASKRVQTMRLFRYLQSVAAHAVQAASQPPVGAANQFMANPEEIAAVNALVSEANMLIIMAVTPFVRELFHGRSKAPTSTHPCSGNLPTASAGNVGSTAPTDSTFQFENPGEYILWLLESGLLRSIVQHHDTSSILYYYYSDPWEVKSMSELPLPGDIAKLGRNKYQLVTPYCGAAALNTLSKAYGATLDNSDSKANSPLTPDRSKRDHRKPTMSDAISAAISTTLATEDENSPGNQILIDVSQNLRKLWESLRVELWLVSVIGSAYEYADRVFGGRNLPPTSHLPYGSGQALGSHAGSTAVLSPYDACTSKYLYRNALFGRVGLPHRFLSSIQVDIFGIKEIQSAQSSFSFSPSLSSGMDLFAMIRVVRGSVSGSSSTSSGIQCPTTGGQFLSTASTDFASKSNSSVGTISGLSALVSGVTGASTPLFGTPKLPWNATHSTAVKRVEPMKSPSGQVGTEYSWKDQGVFKFSLAEGLVSLRRNNVNRDLEGPFFSPPNLLVLTVYERSFFGDSKLGELELSLNLLTDERALRDWVPLHSEKSGTWLVHLQVLQKFSLMALDSAQTSNS